MTLWRIHDGATHSPSAGTSHRWLYLRGVPDVKWIYESSSDNHARALLGTDGTHPLVCFGINPSTAAPGSLDRTVATVEGVAARAGFDSFMMLNVYPQRATDPNEMHHTLDQALHDWNLRSIATFVDERALTVWAAWGTLIGKRSYLPGLLAEIVALPELSNCLWRSRGARSKAGHPHHPLYVRADAPLHNFDVAAYATSL